MGLDSLSPVRCERGVAATCAPERTAPWRPTTASVPQGEQADGVVAHADRELADAAGAAGVGPPRPPSSNEPNVCGVVWLIALECVFIEFTLHTPYLSLIPYLHWPMHEPNVDD